MHNFSLFTCISFSCPGTWRRGAYYKNVYNITFDKHLNPVWHDDSRFFYMALIYYFHEIDGMGVGESTGFSWLEPRLRVFKSHSDSNFESLASVPFNCWPPMLKIVADRSNGLTRSSIVSHCIERMALYRSCDSSVIPVITIKMLTNMMHF